MEVRIVFHPSGDWEALYIDGVLYEEGHSISVEDFIEAYNAASLDYTKVPALIYTTRDLGNEEGFDAEEFSFPTNYANIDLTL